MPRSHPTIQTVLPILALLGLGPLARVQAQDDATLTKAWERLEPAAREEVVEHLRAELDALDTFQLRLVRWVLSRPAPDPGTLLPLPPPPIYLASEHAPDQVERRVLAAGTARARRARERLLGKGPGRRLAPARVYDFASRDVLRLPEVDEAQRVFSNALAGLPPGLDLAEARVLEALDDGTQAAAFAAFGHAYADRQGRVVPGVTLYDAWASGEKIEMPDVECLGLVHDLLGDHDTWRSPVPTRRQRALYDRIAELFRPARAHRELREALARAYLLADPVMPGGYGGQIDRFHALWESVSSEPDAVAERLPAPDGVRAFLADWVKRSNDDPEVLAAGRRRRETLRADAALVRQTLVRVLREHEALGG